MGRFNTVWLVDYGAVYAQYIDGRGFAHFVRRTKDENAPRTELGGNAFGGWPGPKKLPWASMVTRLEERFLPSAPRFSAEPKEQFIAFELPQAAVESAAAAAGVGGSWKEVDLDALGLEVLVEGKDERPGGAVRATLPLAEPAEVPTATSGRRAFAHLHLEGFTPSGSEVLRPELQGPTAELPRLLARYTLTVRAREGEEPRRVFWSREADFRTGRQAQRGVMFREGSWWWGGGREAVPWHMINLVADPGDVPLPELLLPRTALPLGLVEKERDEQSNRDPVGFGETATQTLMTPPRQRTGTPGEGLECMIPPMSESYDEWKARCPEQARQVEGGPAPPRPPREKEHWVRVGLARTLLPGPRAVTNRILWEGMRLFYLRDFGGLVEQPDGSFRSAEGTQYRSVLFMSGDVFVAVYTEPGDTGFEELEAVRAALVPHMIARQAAAGGVPGAVGPRSRATTTPGGRQ
jgi:hypothetical protein